jgi:uncharacterized protein
VLLGCLLPGQNASTYTDALSRLSDRLHYLNTAGDKANDSARYWFDTRANLRREMEDRKRRFNDGTDVRIRISEVLKRAVANQSFFDGTHVFTAHADIPDDAALRLVVLPPERWHARDEQRLAADTVIDSVRNHGDKPRHRGNRLLFLAADHGTLPRLLDATRVTMAWNSIVDDIRDGKLNVDLLQKKSAEKELQAAEDALPRVVRECFRWLLCPTQHAPTDRAITVEPFALNTGGGKLGDEIARICTENELVISTWSPVHLRNKLRELYWKADRPAVPALAFWEDTLRYIYLPRLKNRDVLGQAIRSGAISRDFFGVAYGKTADSYEGFQFGTTLVQVDDTLLLIDPGPAAMYDQARAASSVAPAADGDVAKSATTRPTGRTSKPVGALPALASSFHGTADIRPTTARMALVQLAEEIIAVLAGDPDATVKVTVEISAEFPTGVSEQIRRTVTENANNLALKNSEWD